MAKKHYRVRHWKNYNRALIKRGCITVWIDQESINQWYQDKNSIKQRGRPQIYSNGAIITVLLLKQVYRLSLRSCQGFVESVIALLKLDLDVPSYTQVCRRQESVVLPKLPTFREPIHLVVDSTGLKVFGEGEWKVRQHGWSKRRTWRKLHIGIDENKKFIVTADLTQNNFADDKKLPDLVNQYKGSIRQVSADGAYDSHECFEFITAQGALATIPPQPNPKHKRKTRKDIRRSRDKIVWDIQKHGRERWKEKSGYHRRSLVENAFYRYKQILGEKLMSRKLDKQKKEALIKCHALNRMTLLGMPMSITI